MIFNMVAGGVALNFKIIGGTVQPDNQMENTIWVYTNVEITGWHFGPAAPENPVPDMVWIHTGTSSNAGFNALKKNGIMVYPLSAKQHIDGVWVSKTAKSWQNGNWVDWFPFLYNRGDECIDLTGGWVSRSWEMAENAGSASQTYSIEKNDDYLKFTKTGQVGAVMHTAHKIDLSKVKAIHFKGEMMGGDTYGNWVGFYVWPNLSGRYWNSNAVAKVDGDKAAIKTEFTLDVSSLEPGEYYVGFGIYDPINHVKLEELYLEVT